LEKNAVELLRVVAVEASEVGLLGSSARPLLLLRRGVNGESIYMKDRKCCKLLTMSLRCFSFSSSLYIIIYN
jgi:hypothetical protein